MEIVKAELVNENGVLMKGKGLFENFLETPFKLRDGQYGVWAIFGMSFKGLNDKWINSAFSKKGDAYNHAASQIEEHYRDLMNETGKTLETAVTNEPAVEVATGTTFTAENIPFM